MTESMRDVFICHASEDKSQVVIPLIRAFKKAGISYWYDEAQIKWGDSITKKVNDGLNMSRYVIVVLSPAFLKKSWPQREFNAALNLEASSGEVKVLPLIVGTDEERKNILSKLTLINDKAHMPWSGNTEDIVNALLERLSKAGHIFISYSRDDCLEFAKRLYGVLENDGIDVWLNSRDIQDGSDVDVERDKILRSARAILVLLTPGIHSEPAKSEWIYGLNAHIRLIPLYVQNCKLPRLLNVFDYIDFRTNFQEGIAQLRQKLSTLESDYLTYLKELLTGFEEEKRISKDPGRFKHKIDKLQSAINNWEIRAGFEKQQIAEKKIRITTELKQEKENIVQKAKERQASRKVVGQRLIDIKAHFRDREAQCKEIKELLTDPTTRIVSIVGRGGIGKTALVSKVLDNLEDGSWTHTTEKVPVDGIIYLSTRTNSISLERIFLDCANIVGDERGKKLISVWTNSQLSVKDKVNHLLSELKHDLYIILLDNMEDLLTDERQIKDEELRVFFEISLTTPHDIRLLVTSRVPIKFTKEVMKFDKHILLEDGLPIPHGVGMLRDLDPNGEYGLRDASEKKLEEIVKIVKGVPRAIETFASILANDPFTTIDELLNQNHIFKHKQFVEELIKENYKRLDKDSIKVIEALAVFGCPVPMVVIDYLLEPFTKGVQTREILTRLIQIHTVNINRKNKTVALHPIDCDYIYSQLPKDGVYTREILERRAADYYTQMRTDAKYWETVDDLQPQLKEFEHRVKAGDYDEAALLLNEIDENYLEVWGYNQRLVNMRQQLIGKINNAHLSALNMGKVGRAYNRLAKFELGIDYNHQALRISQSINDKVGQATWLNYIGINYNFIGDFIKAIEFLERGLSIAQESGEQRRVAACLNAIGISYNQLSQYEKSLKFHQNAFELRRKLGNSRWISDSLNNIGEVYINLGNYPRALECFEQKYITGQTPGVWSVEFHRMINISMISMGYGDYKQAIENLTEALGITRDRGSWRWEDTLLGYLADIYKDLGQYELAIEYYSTALEKARGIKSRINESEHLIGLGSIYIVLKRYDEARENLTYSLKIAKEIHSTRQQLESELKLAQLYLLINELDNAIEAITEACLDKTPLYYHRALVFYGIILARLNRYDKAEYIFKETIKETEKLLAMSSRFFAAKYTRGLTFAGLLLFSKKLETEKYLALSQDNYRAALENNNGKGLVAEALQLLTELKPLDHKNILDSIRVILERNQKQQT